MTLQRIALAAAFVFAAAATAGADVFRATVLVPSPTSAGSSLAAQRIIEAQASQALAEAYITERLSPVLVVRRDQQVREALEPLGNLLGPVKIVSRSDAPDNRLRVICEADVDTAGIVLRLVERGILSFAESSPRLLLLPEPGTPLPSLQALRVRISDTVRSAGLTMLANEVVEPASGPSPAARAALMDAAVHAGAHFVALTSVSPVRAPSPAGTILDVTVRYTLLRPHDAAIMAEQTFTRRGSGISEDMALQKVLNEIAPTFAAGLAGRLAESIFSNGRVIDPELPARDLTINVMARPAAATTVAFMDFLRGRGFDAALSTTKTGLTAQGPADRVLIQGRVTLEEIFEILARSTFGPSNSIRASIFDYGPDFLAVELLDRTQPTREPVRLRNATVNSVEPVQPRPAPVGSPAPRLADSARSRPLEFVFSAALLQSQRTRRQ